MQVYQYTVTKRVIAIYFTGRKHQQKLREKAQETKSVSTELPKALNLTPHMVEIAKAVVGTVAPEDVGTHDSGIYCKVCRTIVCGGKDSLQSHLRGNFRISIT